MLIIHGDESTKSEPMLVEMPVWLVHMNLSGLVFLPASAIAQLLRQLFITFFLPFFIFQCSLAPPP